MFEVDILKAIAEGFLTFGLQVVLAFTIFVFILKTILKNT